MRCHIAEALDLRLPPLAVFYAQQAPPDARPLSADCSMILVAHAAKGETVALTLGTCSCSGAGEGFGLEPPSPESFPGGRECFLHFLSVGNRGWEHGREMIRDLKDHGAPKTLLEEFAEGEGFKKSPELVDRYLDEIPVLEPEGPYVVMKPLAALAPGETPKVVVMLADPDQLSALVVLANYARPGLDNVRIPFGAGCASLALYPFSEAAQPTPRAVVGLTDISARYYLGPLLGRDILSFTVPWAMFQEMEADVPESFFTRSTWLSMRRKQG
ncbi:MAG: DUF169 domain-containing protein [Thermoleophilia bacterium]|nr:DUF169 domain-containing protein [Thermoleophilia bacterium]